MALEDTQPDWRDQMEALVNAPAFLTDPVLPSDHSGPELGRLVFRAVLEQIGRSDLIDQIRVTNDSPGLSSLIASGAACWVIDLDHVHDNGISGRDDFLHRVREPVRRPPPAMAHLAAEQHIISAGAHRVQVERNDTDEKNAPYKSCDLKAFGWYVAALKTPEA